MPSVVVNQNIRNLFNDNRVYFSVNSNSRLKDGETLQFPDNIRVEPYSAFLSGNVLCSMGSFSYSWSPFGFGQITVGRYCSIATGVVAMGVRHPIERFTSSSVTYDGNFDMFNAARLDRNSAVLPVKHESPHLNIEIENDVWIGAQVVLKNGIKIGSGAVIGTRAVVTKDVPPYAIVGGIPAKVLKFRFSDSVIADLLDLAWWKYNWVDFKGFSLESEIGVFIEYIKERIRNSELEEFKPKFLTASDLVKASFPHR